MKEKSGSPKNTKSKEASPNDDLPGYPIYPASDDIYSKGQEESDLDPENPSKKKKALPKEKKGTPNEKDFDDDLIGDDLDVPGSPDDEDVEDFELEDEENDYFSLGGDDHNDLEEDLGDDLDF